MSAAIAHAPPTHPLVTYDPVSMETSNKRFEKIWLVAAVVTAVAFVALSAIAFIYTTLEAPIHLPIVSIIIFGAGMPSSFRVFKSMWDKKEVYRKDAKIDAQLIKNMTKNPAQDPKLRSIQARYDYLQDKKARLEQKAQKSLEGVTNTRFNQVDFSDKKAVARLYEETASRLHAFANQQKAASCHLKSATCLHLMEQPTDLRPDHAFFRFPEVDHNVVFAAMAMGDSTARMLVKSGKKTYTASDLLKKTPQQLNTEIYQGKSSGWFRR